MIRGDLVRFLQAVSSVGTPTHVKVVANIFEEFELSAPRLQKECLDQGLIVGGSAGDIESLRQRAVELVTAQAGTNCKDR